MMVLEVVSKFFSHIPPFIKKFLWGSLELVNHFLAFFLEYYCHCTGILPLISCFKSSEHLKWLEILKKLILKVFYPLRFSKFWKSAEFF